MIVIVIIVMLINVNRFVNLDAAGTNMSCDTQDEESKSEGEVSDDDKKRKIELSQEQSTIQVCLFPVHLFDQNTVFFLLPLKY